MRELAQLIADALAQGFRDNAEHTETHQFTIRGEQIRVTVEFVTPFDERVWNEVATDVTHVLERKIPAEAG